MATSRFPRASAVLLTATLAATASAIEFGSENDVTQTAGTVAPGGEMPASTAASGANGFGNFDSPTQWTASSSNNAPTNSPVVASSGSGGWSQPTTTDTPTVWSGGSGQSSGSGQGWASPTTDSPSVWTPTSGQTSGSGSQGWSQPISTDSPSGWTPSSGEGSGTGGQGWTSTASSTAWTPSSGESSGYDDQTLTVDCSGSSEGGWSPGGEMSLECSGSDDTSSPGNDFSLECSGLSEETPSVATSTAGSSNFTPTTTTAPTTSSGADEQPSPTASSSSTAASAEYGDTPQTSSTQSSSDATTSTAASGTADQGSSQATQTSTESSSTTESSSNTAQSTASSSNTATSTASSSNTASSATQGGSDATQTSGNSTSSGNHATFGTVTSKSGECVIGNPNAYVSTADIDWIWENRIGPDAPTRDANWNVADNKNWIMDHIVHNKGSLNYCVRWDSTKKLSKTVASKFKAMLERQYAAWNEWLIGYGCWPYDEIKVNLVGFAVKDASLLDWTDDSLGTITVGDLDSEGVPQCDQSCYRFYDVGLQTWTDTSSCKGEPFDLSLWPKQGLEGGFGYDWGQEVNLENMLSTVDEDQLVIVAHEIGHGFGLPDFYEDADKPNAQWPSCIMMAGSSMTVTPSDGWMLRRVLEHIKSRYNF
ncbi:hypothetical protein PRIC2_013933 [Phytophthora ramorum]